VSETGAWRIIRNRLGTATGASAYFAGRVYPVVLPQGVKLPAATYQVVSAPREHAMGADPGTVHALVQVDVYADSYISTASGRRRVVDAVSRFAGTASGVTVHDVFLDNERDAFVDQLEDGRRTVWRRPLDFRVHYEE
jgi:hypothetical protein